MLGRPSETLKFHVKKSSLQLNYCAYSYKFIVIPWTDREATLPFSVDDTHSVKEYFEMSLQQLGLDYIDLYLMHWPQAIVNGGVTP